MVGEQLHARVDAKRFDALVADLRETTEATEAEVQA